MNTKFIKDLDLCKECEAEDCNHPPDCGGYLVPAKNEYLIVVDNEFNGVRHFRKCDGGFRGGFVNSKTSVWKTLNGAIKNFPHAKDCMVATNDNIKTNIARNKPRKDGYDIFKSKSLKNIRVVERYGGKTVFTGDPKL